MARRPEDIAKVCCSVKKANRLGTRREYILTVVVLMKINIDYVLGIVKKKLDFQG
jgi:hypothetical protein